MDYSHVNNNYKSVMCRYYISGKCNRINCTFAHSEEEIKLSKKNYNKYGKNNKNDSFKKENFLSNKEFFPNLLSSDKTDNDNDNDIDIDNDNSETWVNIAKKNINTNTEKKLTEKIIKLKNELQCNTDNFKKINELLNISIKKNEEKIKEIDFLLKNLNEINNNKSENIDNKKNKSSTDIVILPKTIINKKFKNEESDSELSDNAEYEDDDY